MLEFEGRRTPKLDALVDSGAGYSTFPGEVADALDIDYESYAPNTIDSANGRLRVYLVPVVLHFQNWSFGADVWFNPNPQFRTFLLGRRDVFHHFRIGFASRERQLLLAAY